jgi:hypothetical protein
MGCWCSTNAAGSRLSPGASGEFGSHAIRPRSSHPMQVMTFYELFGHKMAMPSAVPAKSRAKPVPISLRIGITFF